MGNLLFVFLLSQTCFAVDLGASVYHLHQALNYWSLVVSSNCLEGSSIGQKHLNQISDAEFKGTGFTAIYVKVADLYKIKPEKNHLVQTEKLRMDFSDALKKWGIEHKLDWHKEIQANCPNAPKVD